MPVTSNMDLLLPTVTITLGPTYATENNNAFITIDSHDHTFGKGVPVPSLGININNDLTFNDYNATTLRAARFFNQTSALVTLQDINQLYVLNGNLFYVNQLGQQVQITSGAAIDASTIGGIGGDYATSTALEFYTTATSTFTFWSNTNFPAYLDAASITIRNFALNGFGVQLQAPATLAANYNITLPPTNLSGATQFLTYNTSNQIVASTSTVGGIVGSNIANQTLTQGLRAPMIIQNPAVSAGNFGLTASCGLINLNGSQIIFSFSITTTGRPVAIGLISDGTGADAVISLVSSANPMGFTIVNGSDTVYATVIQTPAASLSSPVYYPPSIINFIDTSVAGTPGTYNYTFNSVAPTTGFYVAQVSALKLYYYEI